MKKGKKGYFDSVVMVVFLVLTVMGSAWGAATYTAWTGTLYLSTVDVPGNGTYTATLMQTDSSAQEFVLQSSSLVPSGPVVATYDSSTVLIVSAFAPKRAQRRGS